MRHALLYPHRAVSAGVYSGRAYHYPTSYLPRYPAELSARTGIPIDSAGLDGITHFYRFDQLFRGAGTTPSNVVCPITGTPLSPTGTPVVGSSCGFPGVGFDQGGGTNQRFQAATSGPFTDTGAAFGWIVFGIPMVTQVVAQRTILGKGTAARYRFDLDSDSYTARTVSDDGVSTVNLQAAPALSPVADRVLVMGGTWGVLTIGVSRAGAVALRMSDGQEASNASVALPNAAVYESGGGPIFRIGGFNTSAFFCTPLVFRIAGASVPTTAAGLLNLLRRLMPW